MMMTVGVFSSIIAMGMLHFGGRIAFGVDVEIPSI